LPAARKGSVQIRFEILEYLYFAPVAQPRTHVWRKATTLSYDDFQKHLAYLSEKRLIMDQGDEGITITKGGRGIYDKLRDAIGELL
jgi:predicted transcriptional regulator